jgi:hypothetical protein
MPGASSRKTIFWVSMLLAQAGAFVIFKDLADISQWLVQSTREFTMGVWYNRYLLATFSVVFFVLALWIWWRDRRACPKVLLAFLVAFFTLNFYSGMLNPKLMFRAQQHGAKFVSVDQAPQYIGKSLKWAHFGDDDYSSVDEVSMLVLEIDDGAYAYSDSYLLQPHVVKANTVGGEEVIMTYCGLTNLGIAYSPVIGDKKLDLTVMTQLKNNLVLTDKNSGEAIQQIWGTMERSPDKGKMKEWPTIRMPFGSFKNLYPNGKVFVNEIPSFTENPVLALWDRLVRHVMMYNGVGLQWNRPDEPAFPTIAYRDKRLPMKQLVYALNVGDDYVAYTKDYLLEQGGIVNVQIGGRPIVIDYDNEFDVVAAFFKSSGEPVTDVDIFGHTANGEILERVNTLKSNLFWFILVEFYPQTDVNRA